MLEDMYTVRIEDGFAAAHFLTRYHGRCERLHGHNYKALVTACGPKLEDGGMLLDFGAMKGALRKVVLELDHTSLNDHPAFSDGCPSAERIARFVFEKMRSELPDARLALVEVFRNGQEQGNLLP